jgi:hypothetical protein
MKLLVNPLASSQQSKCSEWVECAASPHQGRYHKVFLCV